MNKDPNQQRLDIIQQADQPISELISNSIEMPNDNLQISNINQNQDNHILKMSVCQVCCSQVQPKYLKAFNDCGHSFCEQCLGKHMQNHIGNYQIIKCLCDGCPQTLSVESAHIKSLSINMQQRYNKISIFEYISKNPHLRLCPTDKCEGFINIEQIPSNCAICNNMFCGKCLLSMHKGDCDKNGVIFAENNLKYRQCHSCKMVVERIDGCPHITCKCGHNFCYLCGQRWHEHHRCPAKMTSRRYLQSILILSIYLFALPLDLVWAVLILVGWPIFFFIIALYMSIAKGIDEMRSSISRLAIFLGSVFILLFFIVKEFGKLMIKEFCRQTWKFWKATSLLPLYHMIWNALADYLHFYNQEVQNQQ